MNIDSTPCHIILLQIYTLYTILKFFVFFFLATSLKLTLI